MTPETHAVIRTVIAAIAAVALVVIAWASYWIAEAEQEQACWASSTFEATAMIANVEVRNAYNARAEKLPYTWAVKPEAIDTWAAKQGLNENCAWRGSRTIFGNGDQP